MRVTLKSRNWAPMNAGRAWSASSTITATSTAQKAFFLEIPAPELDHIRYVCMVDDKRAREELGYSPRHSLEQTVRALDET